VAAFGHDVCEENVCAVFRSGEHTCDVVERVTNVCDDACKRHLLLGAEAGQVTGDFGCKGNNRATFLASTTKIRTRWILQGDYKLMKKCL